MSLTDEQISHIKDTYVGDESPKHPLTYSDWINFGRGIESATAAPLLERIKELEKQLEAARKDALEDAAVKCREIHDEFGGVAEGPFVTDFGRHTHMSMAAGAANCEAAIRSMKEVNTEVDRASGSGRT